MIFKFYKNSIFQSARKQPSHKRQSARTMLDAELKDIRDRLRKLEEELMGNVIAFPTEQTDRAA